MNIFVVFDVSEKLADVKAELRRNGYYASWVSNSISYDLPENSMWKVEAELVEGKNDVEKAINTVNANSGSNIRLLKLIVLQATPWVGKPRTPEE